MMTTTTTTTPDGNMMKLVGSTPSHLQQLPSHPLPNEQSEVGDCSFDDDEASIQDVLIPPPSHDDEDDGTAKQPRNFRWTRRSTTSSTSSSDGRNSMKKCDTTKEGMEMLELHESIESMMSFTDLLNEENDEIGGVPSLGETGEDVPTDAHTDTEDKSPATSSELHESLESMMSLSYSKLADEFGVDDIQVVVDPATTTKEQVAGTDAGEDREGSRQPVYKRTPLVHTKSNSTLPTVAASFSTSKDSLDATQLSSSLVGGGSSVVLGVSCDRFVLMSPPRHSRSNGSLASQLSIPTNASRSHLVSPLSADPSPGHNPKTKKNKKIKWRASKARWHGRPQCRPIKLHNCNMKMN